MAQYFLMHKNIKVALFELNESELEPKPKNLVVNQSEQNHMPIGGQMNNVRFIEWWKDRAIPKTRQGSKTALERLGYPTTTSAMINNLCLSLNDCYWIKPRNNEITWEDINLFQNDFTDSFGELTFNNSNALDLRENTHFLKAIASQGEVQKKWCIDETGRRFMIKGNYGASFQQSINEVFASQMHEQQQWDNFTKYQFTKIKIDDNNDGLGCFSYNFCSEQIESVSAWEILQTAKYKKDESLYHPFKKICIDFGIKEEDFDRFIDYEIESDFLLSNLDRHMNNISILRNPDTLEIIGFAPIYDSGNSMFFKTPADQLYKIHLGQEKACSFTTSKEVNLLKYVKDRRIFDINKLNPDFSIYEKDVDDRKCRAPLLKELFERKITMLDAFQKGKDIWKPTKTFDIPQPAPAKLQKQNDGPDSDDWTGLED